MSVKSLSDLMSGRGGLALHARLRNIDDRFVWMGFVTLADHVAKFGISEVQGKIDLQTYRSLSTTPPPDRKPGPAQGAPRSAVGMYERPERFVPLFDGPRTLDEFLQAPVLKAPDRTAIPFEIASSPGRRLDPDRIRPVLAAIERRECVEISYQSMTSKVAADRVVSPHSLVKASGRWHVRAFDYQRMVFLDLSLSRVSSSRTTEDRQPVPSDLDGDWNSIVSIEFVPHPSLSDDQQKMVASEFDMKRGMLKTSVRRALLFYTLDELGLLAALRSSDSELAKGATLWIRNADIIAAELERTRFSGS
jgi:WYL domain